MIERTDAIGTPESQPDLAITIRPLQENDRESLAAFGASLPQEDLLYFEDDYQNQEIIARLINAHAAENWRQIVAVAENGDIVAYSAVRRLPGWSSHVADIRLLVARKWRRHGIGQRMGKAIFDAARDLETSKVTVTMLEKQVGGQGIFIRLGFTIEGTLRRHALGRDGKEYDVVVMSYFVN